MFSLSSFSPLWVIHTLWESKTAMLTMFGLSFISFWSQYDNCIKIDVWSLVTWSWAVLKKIKKSVILLLSLKICLIGWSSITHSIFCGFCQSFHFQRVCWTSIIASIELVESVATVISVNCYFWASHALAHSCSLKEA